MEVDGGANEKTRVWGVFRPCGPRLEEVELVGPAIGCGRSELCDVVLKSAATVSKEHFFVTKLAVCSVYLVDLSKNGTFVNGRLVGELPQRRTLLQHNDVIAIGQPSQKIYTFRLIVDDAQNEDFLMVDGKLTSYVLGLILKEKADKVVRLTVQKATCKTYAMKQLNNKKYKVDTKQLRNLSHPFLANLIETFHTDYFTYQITEFITGINLNEFVQTERYNNLNHIEIKLLFNQVLLALQYLHQNDLIHKNLNTRNVFVIESNRAFSAKLTDFGLNELIDDRPLAGIFRGLPNFLAPELLDAHSNRVDPQVDVWSLGGILYYMIYKRLPFIQSDGNFFIPYQHLKLVSNAQLNHLICQMLCINPDKRITIAKIVKHPWMEKDLIVKEMSDELPSQETPSKRPKLDVYYV